MGKKKNKKNRVSPSKLQARITETTLKENQGPFNEKNQFLSKANNLIIVLALGILVYSIQRFSGPEAIEFKENLSSVINIIALAGVILLVTGPRMRRKIREGSITSAEYYKFLRLRALANVLVLGSVLFPIIYMSNFSDWLFNELKFLLNETLTDAHTLYFKISTSALAATIGGIVGQVILGAMGSALWDFIKKRKNKS